MMVFDFVVKVRCLRCQVLFCYNVNYFDVLGLVGVEVVWWGNCWLGVVVLCNGDWDCVEMLVYFYCVVVNVVGVGGFY